MWICHLRGIKLHRHTCACPLFYGHTSKLTPAFVNSLSGLDGDLFIKECVDYNTLFSLSRVQKCKYLVHSILKHSCCKFFLDDYRTYPRLRLVLSSVTALSVLCFFLLQGAICLSRGGIAFSVDRSGKEYDCRDPEYGT